MIIDLIYLISAVCFALSLRWMGAVKTSRRGNLVGSIGMILAVAATLMAIKIHRYDLVILAVVVGGIIGAVMALKMPMTAVPQRTALSHAFGALAAALVGAAEYYQHMPLIDPVTLGVIAAEVILGFLTVTGSLIAFAKLQEIIPGKPLIYPGRRFLSILVLLSAAVLGFFLIKNPGAEMLFIGMCGFALLFGILLVMSIGGADMPTVISILNAFAGLSASGLGFVLNNKLLIVAGALDGASGLILSILMCKAMNRSFWNVLFGGVGKVAEKGESGYTSIKPTTAEETAVMLEASRSVIFVPGYGMAVAQAQFAVQELSEQLQLKGVKVGFAIHPVAGRMPGHMNVLLAEANVPYELLKEMDEINPEFKNTDMAIVIGANDVVNPAASQDKSSPIYGMPILKVHEAKTVIVIKRSLGAGFAAIENKLFDQPNTLMLFGDAKEVLQKLGAEIEEM